MNHSERWLAAQAVLACTAQSKLCILCGNDVQVSRKMATPTTRLIGKCAIGVCVAWVLLFVVAFIAGFFNGGNAKIWRYFQKDAFPAMQGTQR